MPRDGNSTAFDRPRKHKPTNGSAPHDTVPGTKRCYEMADNGLYAFPDANAAEYARRNEYTFLPESTRWLSPQFVIDAVAHDGEGDWMLLHWRDPERRERKWLMPLELLGTDGAEIWRAMCGRGLQIATDAASKRMLLAYLAQEARKPRKGDLARLVRMSGWHEGRAGPVFVFPDGSTIGEALNERIIWHQSRPAENLFKVADQVDQWRATVGRLCAGNSRLVFCTSVGFVATGSLPAQQFQPGLSSSGQ